MIKLKSSGLPDSRLQVILKYINKNDQDVIKQVVGFTHDKIKSVKNLESIISDRLAVDETDEWEERIKKQHRIRKIAKEQ